MREASNAEHVLARIAEETGVKLEVLSGADEARLTFLAVRRWFGWSAGRLLVLDIGGGSLEIAYGLDEEPDAAVSLPLGAGRLTSGWLPDDPPDQGDVRALRRHVRAEIARAVGEFNRFSPPDHVVGTSKTFKQLARIAGARPLGRGPVCAARADRESLEEWVPKLAAMPGDERARCRASPRDGPASCWRARWSPRRAMDLFGVEGLEICPWALREGIILRRLDRLREREPPHGRLWDGSRALGLGRRTGGRGAGPGGSTAPGVLRWLGWARKPCAFPMRR